MHKHSKFSFLSKTVLALITINMLISPLSMGQATFLYADDENKITSPNAYEEQDGSIVTTDNSNELNSSETNGPPLSSEEFTESTIDKSGLKEAIKNLSSKILVYEENGFQDQELINAKNTLAQAQDALNNSELSQMEITQLTKKISQVDKTLTKKYDEKLNQARSDIQSRSASWDVSGERAYIGDSKLQEILVAQTVTVDKQLDYNSNEITWTVKISANDGSWANPRIYFWLPENIGVSDFNRDNFNGSLILGLDNFQKFNNEISINSNGEKTTDKQTQFYKKYYATVAENASNQASVLSDLNWWVDTGKLSMLLEDNPGRLIDRSVTTYRFITKHDRQTNLDKVPLGVTIQNMGYRYVRTLMTGSFGIVNRHELKRPEKITYVKNKNNLTETEKLEVKNKIIEETLKYYKNKQPELTKEQAELLAANDNNQIQITSNGAMYISWQDGTVSVLRDVNKYIVQKDLQVDPLEQKVSDQEAIKEIKITGIGPKEFMDSISVDPATPLPEGLSLKNNEDGTLSIVGTLKNIKFDEGQDTQTLTFKVKATDPKDNESIEQLVTIHVKENPGMIPVGTRETGYTIPLSILLLSGVSSMIMWKKLRTREEWIEW
ncbi:putative Ig domain-containing protein [Atopobacter phocae]|uniref:putative Ig domain-containing protein n=1 Tax=Atopobacter phocae TaxID=136492 RepID=UPI000470FBEF|nr:putative Ig domain-containing protein [Atopobacter phocae]